ncbi:hypothetical protein LPJ53_005754 [Coemansia erecta]|uniref:Carbohydrate-binding module family 19 domain-containing protein n=1 Tax=Coemansia erecta TaxID=147472 RepID=A0A9W7XW47_9FUNG|nr:hypothetical protein LPJ53_005754 [Coemansia erecta]
MSICEAADTSLFPDSCLDVAPATAPITAAPSTAVLAESASSAAHATPAMPAYRKHRRGIFDLDFSADATSSSELEFSSDSIADQSTEIIGKSSSIQEAANNIAWSGIDSDSDSVGSGSSNAAKPSATVSDESGIFDIPRGNFLLTSEEGELPAGASPSSMPGTFGGPTTLIFIESGITIDVDDSRSSSGGALDQLSLPAGPTQVPLSIIQSAIMSAQTSRAVKGWHSAFGEESPATLRSDAAASFGENDLGALEKDLTAECATGMMRCAPDNMGFDTCLFGKWGTIRVCAKGTRCITLPGSSIVCA